MGQAFEMSTWEERLNQIRIEANKHDNLLRHFTHVIPALAIAEDRGLDPTKTGADGEYGILQLRQIALDDVQRLYKFQPTRDSIENSVLAGAHYLAACHQYALNYGMAPSLENIIAIWNMGPTAAAREYREYLRAGKDPNSDRSWMFEDTIKLINRFMQALPNEVKAFNEGLYR